jgi:Skp family chaperone for outer membrane proteins
MIMNVKTGILSAIVAVLTLAVSANAQETKLAVVDMQKALNDYKRTKEEVEKINNSR